MTSPQGRTRLDRIATEWAENHGLSPQELAEKTALVLRTLSPDWATIPPEKIGVSLSDGPPGFITIGALADYFHGVGLGRELRTIATTSGNVLAAAVTVDRGWIAIPFADAVKRATFASGFAASANDCPSASAVSNGSPITRPADQPTPPSGSEPGYLDMLQAQQRREAESSAAELVDALQAALKHAEHVIERQRAIISAKDAQVLQLLEENEDLRRGQNEERRGRLAAEESVKEERQGRLAAEEKACDFADLARSLEQVMKHLKPAKDDQAKQQAGEPSPKSRNAYLRTIAALGYALIDGSTGQPHADANAILAAMAARGIEAPIKSDALAGYLKQAEGV